MLRFGLFRDEGGAEWALTLALTSGLDLSVTKEELSEPLPLLWLQVWTCPWRSRSWPNSFPCFDFRFGLVFEKGGTDRALTLALTSGLDLSVTKGELTELLSLLWLQAWTRRRRSWLSSYPCLDFRLGPVRDEGGADRALLPVRQAGGRSARHLPQWTFQGKNVSLLFTMCNFPLPLPCYLLVKISSVVSTVSGSG